MIWGGAEATSAEDALAPAAVATAGVGGFAFEAVA